MTPFSQFHHLFYFLNDKIWYHEWCCNFNLLLVHSRNIQMNLQKNVHSILKTRYLVLPISIYAYYAMKEQSAFSLGLISDWQLLEDWALKSEIDMRPGRHKGRRKKGPRCLLPDLIAANETFPRVSHLAAGEPHASNRQLCWNISGTTVYDWPLLHVPMN